MAPAIVRAPAIPTRLVLDVIRDAVAWAEVHAIPVRIGTYGVRCFSSHGGARWERDPLDTGVDVIGAAILQAQPCETTLPEAGAAALGTTLARAEGLADGMNLEPKASGWMASIAREDYVRGYEAGLMLRISILASVCRRHGAYHFGCRTCPVCELELTAVGGRA